MKRYILTGTPGAGKTAILRQLELKGFGVVEEAATDIIALSQARGIDEPWKTSGFIDAIVELQRIRQIRASGEQPEVQFHDRSIICTAALSTYLGQPFSPALLAELERIRSNRIFETRVFFVRSLGFVSPTAARRISFEESLRFEEIHETTYRDFGFEIVSVGPGLLEDRVAAIEQELMGEPPNRA